MLKEGKGTKQKCLTSQACNLLWQFQKTDHLTLHKIYFVDHDKSSNIGMHNFDFILV